MITLIMWYNVVVVVVVVVVIQELSHTMSASEVITMSLKITCQIWKMHIRCTEAASVSRPG